MLLSNKDIERMEKMDYNRTFFTKSKKGWIKLKNKNGRCVFHNGKICLIYDNKPEGCGLYPLIFDKESKSAVIDDECPYADSFRFNKGDINQLCDLVTQIINERKNRRNNSL